MDAHALTQHALTAVPLHGLATGRGLPNEHYIDNGLFAEERHGLFFAQWAGLAFGKDVPQPGDARPVDFLGVPLLLLRDRDGEIRVFQNTCRHRGMLLVTEPTRIRGAIRCPYHSWCYGMDGSLRSTPNVGGPGQNGHPALNPSDLGLIPIRSHVWRDIVFVNLNGTAPAFEEAHAPLLQRWQEFEQPLHFGGPGSSFELEVQCNWKLAVENYCESYHLPWVHPELNSYSRLEDHYNIEGEGGFAGQGSLVYRQLQDEDGAVLPDFAELGERWNEAAEYIALYPNVLLGVQRDHAFAVLLEPRSCERTSEQIVLYYAQDPATTPELDALRAENARRWRRVFEEDIFVVEGMQKGRHGPHFDGGRFSPVMDGPTQHFHQWVARQFAAPPGALRAAT
ncbi:aromatic ring-hydroxylating oxygenase subunit alpha [Aquibaculum arenosum]|uniref:Aromatic ring-hydroxylating dioxygenase subunit alpha n=1 Tax=Aquibaculum arenosum TaxID=3032591 RepID=A0ABT5YL04_9PROT|nr:aromatic ring-hydroxylating dioxygenase subunit alpha [Fodinicurvata sp. CAU 1616]MDF2095630.1 aromatic ring-hydroxylating dioxygenase subunit alpha [Fodinicurvata sp. CAU 1616]